jgi:hypothetical protein
MFTSSEISDSAIGPQSGVEPPPTIVGADSTSLQAAPFVIRHSSLEAYHRTRPAKTLLFSAALFDPTHVSIFPPCLFHELTGLDCPGCGGQRAAHQLLHGHLIAAIRLNAMFVLSLPLFAWVATRFAVRKFRGEPVAFRLPWWGAYIVAWIVFGVLRNLPFVVCQWFAA